ncbi:peptide-methionine (S)-S-oxide reductase MsrA [Pseudahrensia aquimaris]|uniref:Peptide methionine sulfoxide reductase MsrA n=1 Tax=Pseudahrensia aquimaris TaxID=744461 RepID=A0ABW3FFJ6_9HYPH
MLRKSLLALSIALPSMAATAPMAFSAEAIFAGGCFWCIEKDFEQVAGVGEVVSGYTGGTNENPTYQNHTQFGHREVVKITYDEAKISYDELLKIFFRSVDPTDGGGQFCDRGFSYSTAVYALDGKQLEAAKKAKEQAAKDLGKEIATEITMAAPFTMAEDYHQDYYKKSKIRYNYYRTACGRDRTVKRLWGDQAYYGIGKTS